MLQYRRSVYKNLTGGKGLPGSRKCPIRRGPTTICLTLKEKMSKVVTCRCVQVSAKKFFCLKIVEKVLTFFMMIFPIRPGGKKLKKFLIYFKHRLEEKIVHWELL